MDAQQKRVHMAADPSPKIVLVDESPIRAAILEEGLKEAGYTDVVRIGEMHSLLARIYAHDPDIIVIDLENPGRDILEQMFQVSRAVRRPSRGVARRQSHQSPSPQMTNPGSSPGRRPDLFQRTPALSPGPRP